MLYCLTWASDVSEEREMKTHRFCLRLGVVFVVVLFNLSLVSIASAAQYEVLHAFGTGTDGGGLFKLTP